MVLNFEISILSPSEPYTCFEVFQASTGKVSILQHPAQNEANEVFTQIGAFLPLYDLSKMVRAKRFEAVSPNLEIGPMMRAGISPL